MWAQDAGTMYGYAASSAAASVLSPFERPRTPPPRTPKGPGPRGDPSHRTARNQLRPNRDARDRTAGLDPGHTRGNPTGSSHHHPRTAGLAVEHHRKLLQIRPSHAHQQWTGSLTAANFYTPLLKNSRFPLFRGRPRLVWLQIQQQLTFGLGTTAGGGGAWYPTPQFAGLFLGASHGGARSCHRTPVHGHQDRRTIGALQLGHHPRRRGHRRTRPQSHHRQLPGRRTTRQQRHPARHADDRRRTTRRQRLHPQIRLQTQRPHPTPISRITPLLGVAPILFHPCLFRAAHGRPERHFRKSHSNIRHHRRTRFYPRPDFIPAPGFVPPPQSITRLLRPSRTARRSRQYLGIVARHSHIADGIAHRRAGRTRFRLPAPTTQRRTLVRPGGESGFGGDPANLTDEPETALRLSANRKLIEEHRVEPLPRRRL